ncbi:Rho guanine nucleotide exchange factor [Tilletia horrida]|uniref:Rho guanine nucleotide exchange factor n=1 Tax=Tilletia horrida TaxID=155126 RepID=A0AAN6GS77_9BASI|nr:Rho guanine nucleotide exchange factor [Tilletia horrida]
MAGRFPRPLPPMPGSQVPGAQSTDEQRPQYGLPGPPQQQIPWNASTPAANSSQPQAPAQWSVQPDRPGPQAPHGWQTGPAQYPPQAQPYQNAPYQGSSYHPSYPAAGPAEAAQPDPLALMTFQFSQGPALNTTQIQPPAPLPTSRPPLPVPPINQGAPHANQSSVQHSALPAPPSNFRPSASPSLQHAQSVPFVSTNNVPHGWSVHPNLPANTNITDAWTSSPLSTAADHPLPSVPPSSSPRPHNRASLTGQAAANAAGSYPSAGRNGSRPHSASFQSSLRPGYRHSESGPVQSLAQQLATTTFSQGSSNSSDPTTESSVEIAPYSSANAPWEGVNHETLEELQAPGAWAPPRYDDAIQDHQRRVSTPGSRPGSSSGYFGMPASASNSRFASGAVTNQAGSSDRPGTNGWAVAASSSGHSEGLLSAPQRVLTSSPSQSGSENASTTLYDDDDRMSILSLGSRRAAFSKDLADPDFLANMGIIARDVPLREHERGSLVYPDSFTGKELINTLQEVIPAELFISAQEATSDDQQMHYARLAAMQVADALREQNVFHEVEWDQGEVVDSDEALYAFSDEMLIRHGAGPRRISSFQGAAQQTAEPESMDGASSEAQPVAGPSTDRSTRTHRGPQRSKTLQWSDTVKPELRSKLDKWEVQRQNAIAETIEREEQFLADLELLQELFVEGLRTKSIIAAAEHDDFVKVVFGNHRQLASHIRALVEELHVRQAEHYPLVRRIGDLFLNAALGWREEYCSAITNYPFAANRVQKEEAKNPAFRVFLEECMRDPRAQRHPLTTFLYRPVVRLQRYHLHFKSIMDVIKKSQEATETRRPSDAEASQEFETLTTVSGIIHTQVEDAQRDLGTSQYKVDIANFAEAFAATAKRSEFEVDMDLGNPERQLKHKGQVFLDGVKMQAILFDNYFVLAKEPKTLNEQPSAPQRLVLAKRPIPVELLEMSGFNAQSTSTSLALKFMHLSSSARKVSRQVWPFTVSHSHGRTEPYTLTVSQESARREWQRKLEEACAMRKIVQDAVKAWTVSTLNDDVFAVTNAGATATEMSRDPLLKGTVSAAAPFQILLENQQRPCIAFGTEHGVYVGPRRTSAIQRVLNLRNVTQLAVMEELDLLFVLANKVLWVCRLVDLFVPPAHLTGQDSPPTLQQVSSKEEEILFFNIGMLDNQRVVVFAKKKPYDRGTAFTTLEVHYDSGWSMRAHFSHRHQGVQLKPFGNGRFEVGVDVFSLQFRRKGLSLCTTKGFELCNLGRNESPAFLSVPHPPKKEDVKGQALQKRIKAAKPMALFKIAENEFLLCFNTFGCFVNADRTVARDGAVLEWETEPTSFVFRSPYLLAIDARFVEIRIFNSVMRTATSEANAQSGRLLQFFRGQHMRLVNTQCNDSVDLMPAYDEPRQVLNGQYGAERRHSDQDAIVLCALKKPRPGAQPRPFQAIVEVVPLQYSSTPRAER